ncbi:MAG: hypothetical protein WA709_21020 [Stellaceae bacterium]
MSSGAETALENQRIGALQIGVVAICTLIQMCDGYDVGSIGWAVPSLTHAWNLPPPAFSTAFVWSSIGVVVGARGGTDRRPGGPQAAAARQRRDLWLGLATLRYGRLDGRDEPVALFHRARHRRRIFRDGGADRRLHAAAA